MDNSHMLMVELFSWESEDENCRDRKMSTVSNSTWECLVHQFILNCLRWLNPVVHDMRYEVLDWGDDFPFLSFIAHNIH